RLSDAAGPFRLQPGRTLARRARRRRVRLALPHLPRRLAPALPGRRGAALLVGPRPRRRGPGAGQGLGRLHAGAAGRRLRGWTGENALAGRETTDDGPPGKGPVRLQRAAAVALLLSAVSGLIPARAAAQATAKAYP